MENLSSFGYIKKCYKNYANFNGRASRSEFWNFIFFYCVIFYVLRLPLKPLSETEITSAIDNGNNLVWILSTFSSIFGVVFFFASLLPLLAVAVRRLHDVGRSGWFILVGIVPTFTLLLPINSTILSVLIFFVVLASEIWLLVMFCTKGKPYDNKYGKIENSKE